MKPDIERDLSLAVEELIPIVSSGTPGQGLLDIVERKIKEVLDCKLPFRAKNVLGNIAPDNESLLQIWMCPSGKLCGKEGDSPTACYCKGIDHVLLKGLFSYLTGSRWIFGWSFRCAIDADIY